MKLQNEHGMEVSDELIAKELGMTLDELNKLMADISVSRWFL